MEAGRGTSSKSRLGTAVTNRSGKVAKCEHRSLPSLAQRARLGGGSRQERVLRAHRKNHLESNGSDEDRTLRSEAPVATVPREGGGMSGLAYVNVAIAAVVGLVTFTGALLGAAHHFRGLDE